MQGQFEKEKKIISDKLAETGSPALILVTGDFGTGKTYLINKLLRQARDSFDADAALKFDNYSKIIFLPELTYELLRIPVFSNPEKTFLYDETTYNRTRYFELINEIKENRPDLLDEIVKKPLIKNEYTQDEDNKEFSGQVIDFVSEYLEKKGDRRLLLQTGRVIAESFVVDLMNNFFSLGGSDMQDGFSISKKKRIIIVLEDISTLRQNIIDFIKNDLLPVCLSTSFGDFISYDITFLSRDVKPSDFIDFIFIFSSRDNDIGENFSAVTGAEMIHRRLGLISEEEIVEYINNSGIDSTEVYEMFRYISRGVPAVLDLCLESYKLGQGLHEHRMIYQSAAKQIMKNLTDKQKDWLRCAAFPEKFDADGLRCFPLIRGDYKNAFEFLTKNDEFAEKADEKGFYKVKDVIKEILTEATRDSSRAMASSLKETAQRYKEALPFLKKFEQSERNYLRQLAYFDRFDTGFTFEKAFENESGNALKAFNNHPDIFKKNGFTYSFSDEYQKGFDSVNKLFDLDKYEKKKKLAFQIWKMYENKIEGEIKASREKLDRLDTEEQNLMNEKKLKKQRYEELQSHFILLENEHISQLNKMIAYSNKQNIINSAVFFIISIILILLGWQSPNFFDSIFTADDSYGKTFRIIFYTASFISGIFFVISAAKIIKVSSRGKNLQLLKSEIKSTEEEIIEQQEEMMRIKEFQEDSSARLEEIIKERKQCKENIKNKQNLLKEPFVSV